MIEGIEIFVALVTEPHMEEGSRVSSRLSLSEEESNLDHRRDIYYTAREVWKSLRSREPIIPQLLATPSTETILRLDDQLLVFDPDRHGHVLDQPEEIWKDIQSIRREAEEYGINCIQTSLWLHEEILTDILPKLIRETSSYDLVEILAKACADRGDLDAPMP